MKLVVFGKVSYSVLLGKMLLRYLKNKKTLNIYAAPENLFHFFLMFDSYIAILLMLIFDFIAEIHPESDF